MRNLSEKLGHLTLVCLLATLPMVWVAFKVLGHSVKPYHVFLLLLTALGFSFYCHEVLQVLRRFAVFYGLFYLYLFLILLSTVLNRVQPGGPDLLVKQFSYSLCSIAVAALLVRSTGRQIYGSLRRSVVCSLLLLVGLFALILFLLRIDFFPVLLAALRGGDPQLLAYQLLLPVFQYFYAFGEIDFNVTTGLKNVISTGLAVLFILYRTLPGRPLRENALVSGLLLFFISILLSRSNIIALLICCLFVGLLNLPDIVQFFRRRIFLLALCTAAAAGFFLLLLNIFIARFSDFSSFQARVKGYLLSLELIENHPWLGLGMNVLAGGDEIHNIFLGAFAQGGVFAFAAALGFYLALLVHMIDLGRLRDRWLVPFRITWVSALPLLTLINCLVSGSGGAITLAQWVSLGVFFGVIQLNEVLQRPATDG